MAGNTTTKKEYNHVKAGVAQKARPPKTVSYTNRGGSSEGQLSGDSQKYANPMNDGVPAAISGISGTYDDIGEKSGFITDGYLDKGGVPYGEAAKFNFLPPGMDISNQENMEIHDMPMRKLVDISYPGDGWMPAPRDLPE
jgi:hypothetical protein